MKPVPNQLPSTDPGPLRIAPLLSSHRLDWGTPKEFFAQLDKEFAFSLDPCATAQTAKCPNFFTPEINGLEQDWGAERVFMNPPYGREIANWMRKAWESSRHGALVVCLVPARTDTNWWHTYAMRGEIRFLRGRLKFEGASHSAPFPSAIVIFRPNETGS